MILKEEKMPKRKYYTLKKTMIMKEIETYLMMKNERYCS